MKPIQVCRDHYAASIVGSVGADDRRLIAAFATTAREDFLGPGPWLTFTGSGSPPTVSDDPRLLYQDVLVALARDRGINNGQPTLHARCLAYCAPQLGAAVIHIGAGTGYYTAILAALVGSAGRVLAYEIEPDLAQRAAANLAHLGNVRVLAASAAEGVLPAADVIYVNAGATHPLPSWLDALKPGGRLVFPLTPEHGYGGMLLVTRRDSASYAASIIARVAFIPCIGARDEAASQSLASAFDARPIEAVRSLRRGEQPDGSAWYVGAGWWLSTAEIA